MNCRLLHGDSRELLQALADASIDAVVTDPPYDLTGSGAGGFMGQKWDSTGIAFDAAFWREVLRVAKPGAHLLAFGGTRTHHRMMCAIEDAGWEIKDCPLFWGFGTGFPKHKSLLKPAYEIIVMARKRGAPATLNIDACRIATTDVKTAGNGYGEGYRLHKRQEPWKQAQAGRWPANVLLSHTPLCESRGTREVPNLNRRQNKDGASGTVKSSYSGGLANVGRSWGGTATEQVEDWDCVEGCPVRDVDAQSENASRFFFIAKPSPAERSRGLGGRNPHTTVKPLTLMEHLVKLVTPSDGLVLDPFCGSGTTGFAALSHGYSFIGIEQDAGYLEIARQRLGLFAPETEAIP